MTVQHLPVTQPVHEVHALPVFNPVDAEEEHIISQALSILERRMFRGGEALTSPDTVRRYLRMQLVQEPYEVFSAIFLDNQHKVIAFEQLFQGTIDSASIYPRVVVHKALEHRAVALIIAHNHPSGRSDPSQADKVLTQRLKDVLSWVDVRLLDHLVVGEGEPFSFAEAGLL